MIQDFARRVGSNSFDESMPQQARLVEQGLIRLVLNG